MANCMHTHGQMSATLWDGTDACIYHANTKWQITRLHNLLSLVHAYVQTVGYGVYTHSESINKSSRLKC